MPSPEKDRDPEIIFASDDCEKILKDADLLHTRGLVKHEIEADVKKPLREETGKGDEQFDKYVQVRNEITAFFDRIEKEMDDKGRNKFSVVNEDGDEIGPPKNLPEFLKPLTYEAALNSIMEVYESSPPETTINELLEDIEGVQVCIDGQGIDCVYIEPKED